jgi:plasmid replication initiation protein
MNNEQHDKAMEERFLEVYKRNDMIQKARFSLGVQEQRAVLYAISKIKPDDTYLKEYEFDIKDFYRVIGWNKQSYTEFKAMLKALSDKSWWITLPTGEESLVRWFTTARSNKKSGKVTVKFHEDMMPYLVQLAQGTDFYTKYQLQYILPMSCTYSPRLYEILKSYQYNNRQWYFEIEDLKHLLDCKNYERWPDFRRYVLEPAVAEINKYTDLAICYSLIKSGRKVVRVNFQLVSKTQSEIIKTQREIAEELGQISMDEVLDEFDAERKFWQDRRQAEAEERAIQERREALFGKK